MKQTVLILLTLFFSAFRAANAQTLYKAVYDQARTALTTATGNDKIINQYKINALDYIVKQNREDGTQTDNRYLDTQAVNLESFISDYFEYTAEAAKISEAKREEMQRCYTTASFSHPLFPNASPLVDGGAGELLPFSLNTDWQQAYDQAVTVAKQILKKH